MGIFKNTKQNNTYEQKKTFEEIYKSTYADVSDRLSFYNKIGGDIYNDFETTVNPKYAMDMYDAMEQKWGYLPDYSPTSMLYEYESFLRASKYAGVDSTTASQNYQMYVNGIYNKSIANFKKQYLGLSTYENIFGKNVSSAIKNIDNPTFLNMFNSDAQSITNNLVSAGAKSYVMNTLGNSIYINLLNENRPDLFLEYSNLTGSTTMKNLGFNLYYDYITGGYRDDFKSSLPELVNAELTNNVVIDKANKNIKIYNYNPAVNSYEKMHDVEFWRNTIDKNEGFLKLFDNADKTIRNYAITEFLNDPLYLYITNGSRSSFNQERIEEVENIINKFSGADLNIGSTSSVKDTMQILNNKFSVEKQNLLLMSKEQREEYLKNSSLSDLAIFIKKMQNDPDVISSSTYTSIRNDLDPNILSIGWENLNYIGSQLSKFSAFTFDKLESTPLNKFSTPINGISQHILKIFNKENSGSASEEKFMNSLTEKYGSNITKEQYEKEYSSFVSEELQVYDALQKATVTAYDTTNDIMDKVYTKEDGGTKVWLQLGNFFTLGIGENRARNQSYNEILIKETRANLSDELNSKYTDDDLWNMYNNNLIDVYKGYENFTKKKLEDYVADPVKREELLKEFESNSKTYDSVKKRLENSLNTLSEAEKDFKGGLFQSGNPFYTDSGRLDMAQKGYTYAYDMAVDNSGWLSDLVKESVFDPTMYIGYGELSKGLDILGSGAKAGAKTASKTFRKEKTKITKEFVTNFSEETAKKTSKTLSKDLGEKVQNLMAEEFLNRNSKHASDFAQSIQDMYEAFNKELTLDDLYHSELGDGLFEIQTYLMNSMEKLDSNGIILNEANEEVYKLLNTYKKAPEKERQGILKQINSVFNDTINPTYKEVFKDVSGNQKTFQKFFDLLPSNSIVKQRIKQYADTTDSLLKTSLNFQNGIERRLLDSNNIYEKIAYDLNELFNGNALFKDSNGIKILENLSSKSKKLSEKFYEYVLDDFKSADIFKSELTDMFGHGPAHAIVSYIEDNLLTSERNVEKLIELRLDEDTQAVADLFNKVIKNRRSVRKKFTKIDKKVFNTIMDDEDFKKELHNNIVRFIVAKMDNSLDEEWLINQSIDSVAKKSFHKRLVELADKSQNLAENAKIDEVTASMFKDTDYIFDLSKGYLRQYFKKNPITFVDDILPNFSDKILEKIKKDLDLPENVKSKKLLDSYNAREGRIRVDQINISTILSKYPELVKDILDNIDDYPELKFGILKRKTKKELADELKLSVNSYKKEEYIRRLLEKNREFTPKEISSLLNVANHKTLKKILPKQFDAVKEEIKAIKEHPFKKVEDIIANESKYTDYNAENFLGIVDKFALKEDLELLLNKYNLHSIIHDEVALRQIYNLFISNPIDDLKIDKINQISDLYSKAGKTSSSPLNSIHDSLGGDMFNSFISQFGLEKYQGIDASLKYLLNRSNENVMDLFNVAETQEVFDDYAKVFLKEKNLDDFRYWEKTKGSKKLAKIIRKNFSVTADKVEVHNAVNNAFNATDNVIKSNQKYLQTLRDRLPKPIMRTIDDLYMRKLYINSFGEMTTSMKDFITRLMIDDKAYMSFSMDKERFSKFINDFKEVPINIESNEYTLSDLFNIDFKTKETNLNETINNLSFSFKKELPDDLKKYKQALLDGKDKDFVFTKGYTLQQTILSHMKPLYDDMFSNNFSIRLIDDNMLEKVSLEIDKKIDELKVNNPSVVEEYLKSIDNSFAKLHQGIFDVMYSLDPSLKMFENSAHGKTIITMMRRNGSEKFGIDEYEDFFKNSDQNIMRTIIKKGASKDIEKFKKKKGDIVTDDYTGGMTGITKHASLKGSIDAKNSILKDVYGLDGDAVVTNVNQYINSVFELSQKEVLRSAYGKYFKELITDVYYSGEKIKKEVLKGKKSVTMDQIKNGLYKGQADEYDELKKYLSQKFNKSITDTTKLLVPKDKYYIMRNLGVHLEQLSDINGITNMFKKILKTPQKFMLPLIFNEKSLLTVPLFITTAPGSSVKGLDNLIEKIVADKTYNKLIKNSPNGIEALKKITKRDNITLDEILKIGAESNLTSKELKVWTRFHVFETLRNSSSTSKNYGRYKRYTNTFKDKVEFTSGRDKAIGSTMSYILGKSKGAVMPNMSIMDHAVLTRAYQLFKDRKLLDATLRDFYGEKLVDGATLENISQSAMRIAEAEFGVTDGILSNADSWANSIFVFRNQLMYGIPNIFATYFTTPQGLYSILKMQRRMNMIAMAGTQQNQAEYISNMSEEDLGRFIFGNNIGDSTRLITLNSYSPFDVFTQFAGEDKTTAGVFFDSLNPLIKVLPELFTGKELSNYSSTTSNVSKFAEARSSGDTAGATKYATLALLESETGSVYRFADKMHQLISGKNNSGKELMFLPQSTDAEIGLANYLTYKFGGFNIARADIDNLPILSTVLNDRVSSNTRIESTLSLINNYLYDDKFVQSLGDGYEATAFKQQLYQAQNRRYFIDVLLGDQEVGDELKAIVNHVNSKGSTSDEINMSIKKLKAKKVKRKYDILKQLSSLKKED